MSNRALPVWLGQTHFDYKNVKAAFKTRVVTCVDEPVQSSWQCYHNKKQGRFYRTVFMTGGLEMVKLYEKEREDIFQSLAEVGGLIEKA